MALTAKGAARREALLDAVLVVLERDGAAAITHRAVATAAGVPLAAATYYFESIDDLLVSALRRATEEQVRMLGRYSLGSLRPFAEGIWDWVHTDRAAAVAQYELLFLAMRRDALRPDAELWYRALEDAIDPDRSHAERSRVIAAAIDGLLLRMLWRDDPASVDELERVLGEIVSASSAISA